MCNHPLIKNVLSIYKLLHTWIIPVSLPFSLVISFTTPSPRVFWQMTNINILCCNVKQEYKPAGSDTQRNRGSIYTDTAT